VVPGEVVGVGTGSTVNKFIDALAGMRDQIAGAVSSSLASTERLKALGIPVLDQRGRQPVGLHRRRRRDRRPGLHDQGRRRGADARKIVASLSRRFVCIADESKKVAVLGAFPLPVEVIPMAARASVRALPRSAARAGAPEGRPAPGDRQRPVDSRCARPADHRSAGLRVEVNQWPGVVTVGVFAHQKASVCLLGTPRGVETLTY
jgi:ribose 5-phosphate isomerase A